MKKINYITLVLSVIGTLVFGTGMCMCLLPEWNMFDEGLIVGCAGIIILLVMLITRRVMQGKPAIKLNARMIGFILYAVVSAVLFGFGLSIVLLSPENIVFGIVVGIIGIALLLGFIPMIKDIN